MKFTAMKMLNCFIQIIVATNTLCLSGPAVTNSSDLDLLLLPASYKPEAITSYESLVEFCNVLVQSVDATDGNEDVLLGFNVEWDSLTAADKK